ncbi:MAG: thiamine pyrophosphate-requiring protein [Pseudomonadota bacterium]
MADDRESTAGAERLVAGGALLARLKVLGVDGIFAGVGTDYPPIIEGLLEAKARGIAVPEALVVPYEHAAVAMAHGAHLADGKTYGVLLHTNVGLANGVIGLINAATDNIPMIVMSGRTPITEQGHLGSRDIPIGWGQEMRDQTGLVRDLVKWDYELRYPEQIPEVLDRALAIANSTPKGPVYVSLPREVLCEAVSAEGLLAPAGVRPVTVSAEPQSLTEIAGRLADAERPVIFAQRGAGSAAGFATLTKLVEDWAIPVVHYWADRVAIPSSHPMQAGESPEPWLSEADFVLVIDSLAPWSPKDGQPDPACKVAHLGPDPLQSRTPIRGFRADLSVVSEVGPGLVSLAKAMAPKLAEKKGQIETRRPLIKARTDAIREQDLNAALEGKGVPINKAWVGHCIAEAIKEEEATVVHELGCPLGALDLKGHGAWYLEPLSGGLGWGLPAAMGLQLAEPGRLVVATLGDGSYLFANPVACHQVMERYGLPVLTVILNNAGWGTVQQAVKSLFPEGHAAKANEMPLVGLSPSPDFVKVAEASRAYAERVSDGAQLPDALARALAVVKEERRQALLEITVA